MVAHARARVWVQVDTTWVQLHDHATADLLSGRVHREMRWLVEWWKHRCAVCEANYLCAQKACDAWAAPSPPSDWTLLALDTCTPPPVARNDPRVKFFFFKDMLANHRAVVEEMAAFMELDVNESVIDTVVSQSTHAYMSSAEHRHR